MLVLHQLAFRPLHQRLAVSISIAVPNHVACPLRIYYLLLTSREDEIFTIGAKFSSFSVYTGNVRFKIHRCPKKKLPGKLILKKINSRGVSAFLESAVSENWTISTCFRLNELSC